MNFWNRLVRSVYRSLAANHSKGRKDVSDVLLGASGLLPITRLDNLSLALIVLSCDVGQQLRIDADRKLRSKDGWQFDMADGLAHYLDWSDLLEVFAEGDTTQQDFVFEAVRVALGPDLIHFLGVMRLQDHDWGEAEDFIWSALLEYKAGRFQTPSTYLKPSNDLECWLYQFVSGQIEDSTSRKWPDPEPNWKKARDSTYERPFMDCARSLQLDQRWLLYLSFYASLTADQIGAVLNKGWRTQDLRRQLKITWKKTLSCMKNRLPRMP
jgi:hypothetical protein